MHSPGYPHSPIAFIARIHLAPAATVPRRKKCKAKAPKFIAPLRLCVKSVVYCHGVCGGD